MPATAAVNVLNTYTLIQLQAWRNYNLESDSRRSSTGNAALNFLFFLCVIEFFYYVTSPPPSHTHTRTLSLSRAPPSPYPTAPRPSRAHVLHSFYTLNTAIFLKTVYFLTINLFEWPWNDYTLQTIMIDRFRKILLFLSAS
jgi:hypothetical protein